MQKTTLCLLIKPNQILLAIKKRGFGFGKYNGYGGKLKKGESLKEAAIRETREEIGVNVKKKDLVKVGALKFHFSHKPDWDQEVNIFLIKTWCGKPTESEEMKPKWFYFKDIPYEQMWPDDKFWLPKVLNGKKVTGDFHFKKNNSGFSKFELTEI